MLFILILWIPFTHESQVEYHLSEKFRAKLADGFEDVVDFDTFASWNGKMLEGIFYPSV